MTYIPVGTVLTYTAQVSQGGFLFSGFSNPTDLLAKLKVDLPNLQGMEELDITASNTVGNFLGIGKYAISLEILNNGVDHGSETDIQSIIDGTIQGYGNAVLSSNIIVKALPNNPTDAQNNPIVINNPNVTPNAPAPTIPSSSSGSIFSGLSLSGGSIAGISITTIIIVLIIAVLLLPKNARTLVGG